MPIRDIKWPVSNAWGRGWEGGHLTSIRYLSQRLKLSMYIQVHDFLRVLGFGIENFAF